MKLTIDVRWDNNDGADKICKQLGYEEGVKGPRNTISKRSGPIHIVSRARSDYKDDVINEIYKLCTHAIDQAVACKGGLGATPGKTTIVMGSHKNTAQCTNHEQPQPGYILVAVAHGWYIYSSSIFAVCENQNCGSFTAFGLRRDYQSDLEGLSMELRIGIAKKVEPLCATQPSPNLLPGFQLYSSPTTCSLSRLFSSLAGCSGGQMTSFR